MWCRWLPVPSLYFPGGVNMNDWMPLFEPVPLEVPGPLIIAGSRWFEPAEAKTLVYAAVSACGWPRELFTEVVSGKARGIDTAGEDWAKENGLGVAPFPADWDRDGNAAGSIRNGEMARYGARLIAIPHPERLSNGTHDMIRKMRALHKPVFIYKLGATT